LCYDPLKFILCFLDLFTTRQFHARGPLWVNGPASTWGWP
jgi:hypothetical protein